VQIQRRERKKKGVFIACIYCLLILALPETDGGHTQLRNLLPNEKNSYAVLQQSGYMVGREPLGLFL